MSRRAPALAFGALLLAGCAGGAPRDPRELVVGLEANPTSFDPRMATGAAAVRILPLLFNSLIRLDPAGRPAPERALSWENPSPTEYVLHLRRGVRFHDGSALTAADVKYTYDFMREPANRSPNLGAHAVVAAVEAPDPQTGALPPPGALLLLPPRPHPRHRARAPRRRGGQSYELLS